MKLKDKIAHLEYNIADVEDIKVVSKPPQKGIQ